MFFKRNKKNTSSKVTHTLLFKEQFKYFKTTHAYHLVDPIWPLVASLGAFMFGTVSYMHKFIGGWNLLITGFSIILYVMFTWWRDIIRATFEDTYYNSSKGLRLGMILFIVSE
jgi:cytochrome c oxidase subunit 3